MRGLTHPESQQRSGGHRGSIVLYSRALFESWHGGLSELFQKEGLLWTRLYRHAISGFEEVHPSAPIGMEVLWFLPDRIQIGSVCGPDRWILAGFLPFNFALNLVQ